MIKKTLFAIVFLFCSQVALAQQEQSNKFQEGTHYLKLAQVTEDHCDFDTVVI